MRFINRENELNTLKKSLDLLIRNQWADTYHVAVLGLRRTGKTFLVKHFLDTVASKRRVCIQFSDVAKIANSPRDFARNYVLSALKSYCSRNSDDLMELALLTDSRETARAIDRFQQKILVSGSNEDIIRFAFAIHGYLGKKKWIVALDEFQEILSLQAFKGIKSIDAFFRSSIQENKNVFYIISGSYPALMREWLESGDKYLFSHFNILQISEFSRKNTCQMASSMVQGLPEKEKSDLYTYSCGNPYLIAVFMRQYLLKKRPFEEIFKDEVFHSTGSVNNYFNYMLNVSVGKIRGHGILKETLKTLAVDDTPLSAPEIAGKIGKNLEEIHNALKGLMRIDIIYCAERKYYFRNLPFKYYLRYQYMGLDQFEFEKSKYLVQKVRELDESFQRVSKELGRAKEFELYYQVSGNQGKVLWGLKIPKFKVMEKNRIISGREIDLNAVTFRGKVWVFELKWKSKLVGKKEVEGFLKIKDADRYIYISKSGFTEEVKNLYKDRKNIFLIVP